MQDQPVKGAPASRNGAASQRIETPRLLIRRFTAADWAAFQSLANDYNSSSGGTYEGKWPTSEDDCKKSVESMSTSSSYFAAYLRDPERLIGMLVLNGMDSNAQMDLGYIVHTEFQDADHDREALEAIIGHIFTAEKASSIVVRWVPQWTQQFVVPKALGFTPVGNRKGEMQLTREQWEQSQKP